MKSKGPMLSFLNTVFLLIILGSSCLITSSCSKSIIKNLPGFSGDLPFAFETGYVGVGKDEQVQFFYYFFESERNPQLDPLLLYLTGGPGTSAILSIFYQIGPLTFNFENSLENVTLELKPYSWTKTANVIFVDLPVGTGFSYAKTWQASRSNDSLLASQIYDFLRKWLMDHPNFLSNPLYITGISYMGLILPIVVSSIYDSNERGVQPPFNIKGYLIISPLTHKVLDFNSRIKFAHRTALISDEIYESAKENCGGNYVSVASSNSLCVNSLQRYDECTSRINLERITDPLCNEDANCSRNMEYSVTWANDKAVQKALHVREGAVERWGYQNSSIHYTFGKTDNIYYSYNILSSFDYHKQLIAKNCRALIISGDHDMTFPYVGVEEWIRKLKLETASPWEPWFVNTQIAGYQVILSRNEYSLKYATVKGSGHSIALYNPEELMIMVDRWLASQTDSRKRFLLY